METITMVIMFLEVERYLLLFNVDMDYLITLNIYIETDTRKIPALISNIGELGININHDILE